MRKELENDGKWIIEFETNNEKFYLYQMNEGNKEEHGIYDSYENTQKAIDRAEAIKKRKIAPLPIIKQERYGDSTYKKGKITSIAEVTDYNVYVWISVEKSRSKESGKLLKDIVDNDNILKKITELKETISKEEEKLVYYSDDEIKKHFGENETG